MKILALNKSTGKLHSLSRFNHTTFWAAEIPRPAKQSRAFQYHVSEINDYFYILSALHKESRLVQLYVLNRVKNKLAVI